LKKELPTDGGSLKMIYPHYDGCKKGAVEKESDTPKVCWMHHACGAEDDALTGIPQA
jgi:hypothetical protein